MPASPDLISAFNFENPGPYRYWKTGNHLYYANNEEVNHIDCGDVKLPYFRNLINDVLNRSETACSQELTYLTMELSIKAQELAEKKWANIKWQLLEPI